MADEKKIPVLVVDDEIFILKIFQEVLGAKADGKIDEQMENLEEKLFGKKASHKPSYTYRVITCSQAKEAVEVVENAVKNNEPFPLVFMDVRMPPGKDGVWAAEQIRKLDPEINIVIVTAYSDEDIYKINQRVPPEDKLFYLQKPLHVNEIWQFTHALTKKWDIERELREKIAEVTSKLEEISGGSTII